MINRQKFTAAAAGVAIAATALGFAGLATAGAASAVSSNDTPASGVDIAFLQALQDQGIVVNDEAGAVRLGQSVCVNLGKGSTTSRELDQILDSTNLTDRQGSTVVATAITVFCPQHKNLL